MIASLTRKTMPIRNSGGRWILAASVALAWMAGCGASVSGLPQEDRMFYVHPSPPRCSCILVVPFSNLSNVSQAGGQSSRIIATRLNASGKMYAFDMPSLLRALNVSPPPELSANFALEVALVVEADAVLFGTVGGLDAGKLPGQLLWIDARLLSRSGELLWAHSQLIRPEGSGSTEPVQDSLNRQAEDMAARLLSELRPRQDIVLGACLHPDVRRALPSIFGAGNVDKIAGAGIIEAPPPAPPPSVPEKKEAAPAEKTEPAPEKEAPKPEMSAEAQVILEHLDGGKSLQLRGVRFEGRTTELSEQDDPFLPGLGDLLQARPDLIIQILVHTDATVDAQADLELTHQQAKVVAKRLRERWKLTPDRIQAVGMGGKHPVQVNITKRGRQANRRVEVVLVRGAAAK